MSHVLQTRCKAKKVREPAAHAWTRADLLEDFMHAQYCEIVLEIVLASNKVKYTV